MVDRWFWRPTTIVVVAAAVYGLLGLVWLRVAYPPDGDLRRTTLHVAIELALAAVFVASVAATAVGIERKYPAGSEGEWRWVLASAGTAVIALVGGLILFRVGERLWWPTFSGGCHLYTHPTGGWTDGVCSLPFPLEHAASSPPMGWPLFWLGIAASALLIGAVSIIVRRRLGSPAGV